MHDIYLTSDGTANGKVDHAYIRDKLGLNFRMEFPRKYVSNDIYYFYFDFTSDWAMARPLDIVDVESNLFKVDKTLTKIEEILKYPFNFISR